MSTATTDEGLFDLDAMDVAPKAAPREPQVTEKQIAFITSLASERDLNDAFRALVEEVRSGDFPRGAASHLIDNLLGMPRAAKPAPVDDEALVGMHKVGDVIYKVQRAVHGSGHLYAKRLVLTGECEGHPGLGDETEYCDGSCRPTEMVVSFEYAPGALRKLSADTKLSKADAKRFGALYGTCCVCGRTLTDETSIANGIGPVCERRLDR